MPGKLAHHRGDRVVGSELAVALPSLLCKRPPTPVASPTRTAVTRQHCHTQGTAGRCPMPRGAIAQIQQSSPPVLIHRRSYCLHTAPLDAREEREIEATRVPRPPARQGQAPTNGSRGG